MRLLLRLGCQPQAAAMEAAAQQLGNQLISSDWMVGPPDEVGLPAVVGRAGWLLSVHAPPAWPSESAWSRKASS